MADTADTQESQDSSVEETTAESQSDNQTGEQTSQSTDESTDSSKQEGNTEGKADQSASTGDKSKSGDQDSNKDSKPLSRRSAAYRIKQLVEENNILKQKLNPKEQEQDDWENPQEDDKPDISKLVAQEVEKHLKPVITESSKAADDSELNELFSGDRASDRPKYESKIRDMWKLPQYKDVAAVDLHKIVSFDDAVSSAVAKGIEDYKQAQKEAKESSASGTSNSNRTGKGGKSVNDMTDEEFRQHNERVKAGQA